MSKPAATQAQEEHTHMKQEEAWLTYQQCRTSLALLLGSGQDVV